MATLPHGVRVFLCTQATDMRKSFDGLIAATKSVIGQDPLSGHLFVFVNRQANYASRPCKIQMTAHSPHARRGAGVRFAVIEPLRSAVDVSIAYTA